MIEHITDEKGNLQAYLEFFVTDKNGKIDDNGTFIYINEMYINPCLRCKDVIHKFIEIVTKRVPYFEYGYFVRRKYGLRQTCFSREQWIKIALKNLKRGDNYGRK